MRAADGVSIDTVQPVGGVTLRYLSLSLSVTPPTGWTVSIDTPPAARTSRPTALIGHQ